MAARTAVSGPIPTGVLAAGIGPGETEAITLALDIHPSWIILDDRSARRLAESLDLPVIGVLGILRLAKILGAIDRISPLVESLRSTRFFVDDRLVKQLLAEFGEDQ